MSAASPVGSNAMPALPTVLRVVLAKSLPSCLHISLIFAFFAKIYVGYGRKKLSIRVEIRKAKLSKKRPLYPLQMLSSWDKGASMLRNATESIGFFSYSEASRNIEM